MEFCKDSTLDIIVHLLTLLRYWARKIKIRGSAWTPGRIVGDCLVFLGDHITPSGNVRVCCFWTYQLLSCRNRSFVQHLFFRRPKHIVFPLEMFGTYPETLWHLAGTMVLKLLDNFVVLAQFDPLFTQALVGRELVERQVLRAPARVGAFVETTVHVRRHRVVVVVVVRAAAFGGRAAAAAAMRYGTSLLCSRAHTRARCGKRGRRWRIWDARRLSVRKFFFLKIKTLFHALITGCVITVRVGGIVRQAVRFFSIPRPVQQQHRACPTWRTRRFIICLVSRTVQQWYDINMIYDDVRTAVRYTKARASAHS